MISQVVLRTTAEGNFRITVNDKILVHLVDYVRYRERHEVPREITQQGIAEVVNARRSHVSMALSTLKDRGLIEEFTLRVIDDVRRKKTYFLTSKGYSAGKQIVEDFQSKHVIVKDVDQEREVAISELPEVLGEKFYLVDILCCISRDGTLNLEQLTGQEVEKQPEEIKAVQQSPTQTLPRAQSTCPACNIMVEFPYDAEGLLTVVCGNCGNAFRASVGAPIAEEMIEPKETITDELPVISSKLFGLKLATALTFIGIVILFTPFGLLTLMSTLIVIPIAVSSITRVESSLNKLAIIVAILLLATFLFTIFQWRLAIVAIGSYVAACALLGGVLINAAWKSVNGKVALGGGFAVIGAFLPILSIWGLVLGLGFVVASAIILAGTALHTKESDSRDRDKIVASWLIATLGVVTYAHWVFWPFWDGAAILRMMLVVVPLYAFAMFAKPIKKSYRSEITAVMGIYLTALAACIAIAPWLVGWTSDLAAYFLIFGTGAVYISIRIQKLDNVWVPVCLGSGLFIITLCLATLILQWSTLSPWWLMAIILWIVAGITLCTSRFVQRVIEHLASIRTGVLSAAGASLILIGAYIVLNGLGVEGAVEIILGVPLLAYSFLRSNAPWTKRLTMTLLFISTIGLTWLAFVSTII